MIPLLFTSAAFDKLVMVRFVSDLIHWLSCHQILSNHMCRMQSQCTITFYWTSTSGGRNSGCNAGLECTTTFKETQRIYIAYLVSSDLLWGTFKPATLFCSWIILEVQYIDDSPCATRLQQSLVLEWFAIIRSAIVQWTALLCQVEWWHIISQWIYLIILDFKQHD